MRRSEPSGNTRATGRRSSIARAMLVETELDLDLCHVCLQVGSCLQVGLAAMVDADTVPTHTRARSSVLFHG
jgi:hypothetical protein